jgi:hemolysin activation/secretion protein
MSVCAAAPVLAQPEQSSPPKVLIDPPAPIESDGFAYPVSSIQFAYPFAHDELPELDELNTIPVLLGKIDAGFVAPREGIPLVALRVGDLTKDGHTVIYGSALASINNAVRDALESRYGMIGHLVTPDAQQIEYRTTQRDIRPSGDQTLNILIWRAAIGEVRTVARGDRLVKDIEEPESAPAESNVNRPEHSRLRDRFLLSEGDLLTRHRADDEVHRLNRHPGRKADIAIAPSSEPGEVVVDYIITEPKPWTAYVAVSNTGTESTDEWRERFGFMHRQLTGRDDVLRLDYITSWFDETNAFLASYEFDAGYNNRLKLFGNWSEYTARDVGLGFENFKGESYALGAEFRRNVWQDGPKFVDLVAGVRYEHINVENQILLLEGTEEFLLPTIGVRYQKNTPLHNAYADLMLEVNWGSVVGTDELDVARLGRFGADENFTILKGQLSHSFYLDPYLDPEGFRGEKGRDEMKLAHELALNLRGQWTFNSRLAPNFESVAGGAYSVRGYPESSAVGDDAIIGTIEYRYHLGRSTPINAETTTLFGQGFRSSRTQPYGSADWDLIFKGFLDVGRVSPNDAPFFERAETLVGAGVGIEAQIRSNLTLRLDYGMAFTPIGVGTSRSVDVGDSRLHFLAQFAF